MPSVSPAPARPPAGKVPSAARIQLDTLTGMRGVASMLVYLTHSGMEPVFRHAQINQTIVHLSAGTGEAAVSFFFMLSGFVLVWASGASDTMRSFWRRRVVKIYPNTIVTWTAGLVLMIVAGEFTSGWNVLPSLPLIHVWIPIESVVQGTDGPAWSLSCEVFFYALFPFLLLRMRRIREDRLWRWTLGIIGVITAFTVLVGLTVPSQPQALDQPVSLYQFYILIFLPPVRLLDFALGMLLCRIVVAGRWPAVTWPMIAAALLAGWVASVLLPRPLGFVVPLIPANVLLIGKAASMDIARRPSFLTWRTVVWLGEVSFAFYLIHWLVLHFSRVFLGGGPWSTRIALTFLIGCLALSLTLAECLRRFVEIPMMRRYARSTPKPAPIATPRQHSDGEPAALTGKSEASTPIVSATVE